MLRYQTPIRQLSALAHRLGAGRNPLRRRSDRIEAAATTVGAAVLVAAAAIGIGVGAHVAADQARRADYQQATRHQVTAVLVEPAGIGTSATATATARWHTGHGTRTGTITVRPGLPAGSRVSIWIDRSGSPTSQPLTGTGARLTGVMYGSAVPVGAALLALLAVRLVRYRLDRHRLTNWADEWDRIEPQWTRRRTQ